MVVLAAAQRSCAKNHLLFPSYIRRQLGDVGTYKVGTIAALGGGKYTINSATAKNWTEIVAANLGLPAPCPAQTGLEGLASQASTSPVKVNAGCTGYASKVVHA